MLVACCSMLVKYPVFIGDKPKNILYFIQYPETSIQYHELSCWNHVFLQKLDSEFKILAYIGG